MTYPLLVGDHGEQVTFLSVVHHHVQELALLNEPVHSDDAAVRRGQTVESNLTPLEMPLPSIETGASKAFNCAVHRLRITRVDAEVHYAVRAGADDRDQLDESIVDKLRRRRNRGGRGHGVLAFAFAVAFRWLQRQGEARGKASRIINSTAALQGPVEIEMTMNRRYLFCATASPGRHTNEEERDDQQRVVR
jgi:hypothetical protein